MWSKFTLENFNKIYKLQKNKLNINNLIIDKMNNEKNNIINMKNINYQINDTKIKNIDKYASTKWVDYDGVMNALNDLNIEKKIEWKNNDNKNIIYLKCTNEKYNNIIKRLNIFLKMINYLQKDTNKDIIIYLILTKLKKIYNNDDDIISPKNINSGYTDLNENYIFIWREEEFEKLTFHELIHFFDKDHRDKNIDLKIFIDDKEIIIKNNKSYYEAITDFKAICYNIIYLSIITNKKILSLLNYELLFIENQSNYMLDKILNNNKIEQNSPAFSYFILKNVLFNKIISDKLSIDEINNIFSNLDIININKKNFINFNSCRMTLFELL
jgi:hypothetical protein